MRCARQPPPRVTRGVRVTSDADGASTGHARIPGCGVTREYGSGVTRAYGSRAYVRGTPVRVTPVRVTVTQPLLLYRLIEYTVKSIIAQPEAERAGAQRWGLINLTHGGLSPPVGSSQSSAWFAPVRRARRIAAAAAPASRFSGLEKCRGRYHPSPRRRRRRRRPLRLTSRRRRPHGTSRLLMCLALQRWP